MILNVNYKVDTVIGRKTNTTASNSARINKPSGTDYFSSSSQRLSPSPSRYKMFEGVHQCMQSNVMT